MGIPEKLFAYVIFVSLSSCSRGNQQIIQTHYGSEWEDVRIWRLISGILEAELKQLCERLCKKK
jgi:hypothetical protein